MKRRKWLKINTFHPKEAPYQAELRPVLSARKADRKGHLATTADSGKLESEKRGRDNKAFYKNGCHPEPF